MNPQSHPDADAQAGTGAVPAPPPKGARGGRRSRRAELLVVGAVGLLFLCVCCVVGTTTYLLWRAVTRLVNSTDLAAPGRPADPNAPDPDEGPPPPGWTVLFRSDDPSVWNTESPGKNFALPVRRAHSKIRFLRLTRLDTHEALIVPVEHFELARDDRPPSAPGHWWAGKSQKVWGAYRLGIAGVPSASRDNVGIIGLAFDHTTVYSGSGFGFKTGLGDQQYYCWQGEEIRRTAFEIAVSTGPLTDEERKRFTGPDPDEAPAPPDWTVLFRSDDPADWNTFRDGKRFAVPVGRAHAATRYLRLTRTDTGEALILPVTRRDLAAEPGPAFVKGFAWCGSARLEYGGRHLGILQAPPERWPTVTPRSIGVMAVGWDAYFGSGFGHLRGVNQGQFCSWRGHEIAPTAFEIAVTTAPLAEDEKRHLLK